MFQVLFLLNQNQTLEDEQAQADQEALFNQFVYKIISQQQEE